MALSALINTSSGSVPEAAEDLLRAELPRRFETIRVCEGCDLPDALKSLYVEEGDTVVVWGGDGTVSAALTHFAGRGVSTLPLPGGTMNLLHKRVHKRDDDWTAILRSALKRNSPDELTYANANGEHVYVALLLGRLTHLAEAREAIRDGEPLLAARQIVGADALDLETAFCVSIDGATLDATACVALMPEDLRSDRLDFGVIDPESLVGLATTGLSALLQDWRSASGVSFRQSRSAEFRAIGNEDLHVLVDGEPRTLGPNISVDIRCGDVLVQSAR